EEAPRFWLWKHFEDWLLNPRDDEVLPSDLGLRGLETNTRMHVSIRPQSQTAEEGLLFQTRGLEFTRRDRTLEKDGGFHVQRLALAAQCHCPSFEPFTGGFAPLGGERRLMRWYSSDQAWPPLPQELGRRIATARACRVVLLTPAIFQAGYRPAWLLVPQPGV